MKNRRNIVELKYPPENPNDIWLKDGKFYRSTSEGWIVIDSKTEYTSKESMIADNPKGGTIGIDKETGETSIYNDVAEQWSPLSGGGVTSITWKELKDKRDAGKLIPGSLYRITDYNCTTTQENTQSAGHQFDIVLLALSEDKLAEEGWAMMHDNIYDVTFADGVTKKCYLFAYVNGNFPAYNIVDVETKLGVGSVSELELQVNEETKTIATEDWDSTDLIDENLPYNYFQNSNLSAWKVWYCLDNDKSRFAWADDRNDVSTKECINESLYRNKNLDTEVSGTNYYGWGSGNFSCCYTTSEHPEIGDDIYKRGLSIGASSFTATGTVKIYSPDYNGKSTKECIDVHIIIKGLDGLNVDQIQNGVEKIKEPNSSTIVMDDITYYIWGIDGSGTVGTLNRIPKEGDIVYIPMPVGATPGQYVMTDVGRVIKYHPEYNIEKGRGVIYRLIDEWNNDCPYDFKNIQTKLDGEDAYEYTFYIGPIGEMIGINPHIDLSIPFSVRETTFMSTNNKIGYFINETIGGGHNIGQFLIPFVHLEFIAFSNTIGSHASQVKLKQCNFNTIGDFAAYISLDNVSYSSFGHNCGLNGEITITSRTDLNYGNGGVELATKS